jgi:hypothetical protein
MRGVSESEGLYMSDWILIGQFNKPSQS